MKRQILATGLAAVLLTGCAGGVELSQGDNDRVAQYAANLLLKYDKNYKETLLSEKEMEEAKEKLRIAAEKEAELQALIASKNKSETEKTEESINETTENAETDVMVTHVLQDVLNMPGFEIQNTGYSIVAEYPESAEADEVLAVEVKASPGKKLLVMKYNITNCTTDNLECDLFSKDISSDIIINGSMKAGSMLTMLLNDLGTLKVEIEAGESYEAVQVFEVSEDVHAVEQLKMNMNIGDETFAIQL